MKDPDDLDASIMRQGAIENQVLRKVRDLPGTDIPRLGVSECTGATRAGASRKDRGADQCSSERISDYKSPFATYQLRISLSPFTRRTIALPAHTCTLLPRP